MSKNDEMVSCGIYLPQWVHEAIKKIAEADDRSWNEMAVKILKNYAIAQGYEKGGKGNVS